MNLKEIRGILKLLEEFDLQEIEIKEGDISIRARRKGVEAELIPAATTRHGIQEAALPPMPESKVEKEVSAGGKEGEGVPEDGEIIKSPMVGTFYRAPGPEDPPFVEPGQVVKKGQVLCIIEAMKLMNEIESEFECKILNIFPKNGEPVEYGEKLLLVQRL